MAGKKRKKQRARQAESAQGTQRNKIIVTVIITLVVGMYLGGMLLPALQEASAPRGTQQGAPQGSKAKDFSAQIAKVRGQLEQNQDSASLWSKLGHLYFDSHQYPEAIEAYNRSLSLNPGDADVLTDLGVMYRRNGNPEKAVETFDRAIAADPTHETSRFNKGIVLLYDIHDKPGALEAWRGLVELNPGARTPQGKPVKDLIRETS